MVPGPCGSSRQSEGHSRFRPGKIMGKRLGKIGHMVVKTWFYRQQIGISWDLTWFHFNKKRENHGKHADETATNGNFRWVEWKKQGISDLLPSWFVRKKLLWPPAPDSFGTSLILVACRSHFGVIQSPQNAVSSNPLLPSGYVKIAIENGHF